MIRSLVIAATLSGLALLANEQTAEAQCPPGSTFCAQVQFGVPVPPPPAVVYVQPAPPPPPPVIVVRPAPPPVVVYQPAPPPPPPAPPAVVYVQARPAPAPTPAPAPREPHIGLHGHIGGMLSDEVDMGGATAALRLRPSSHIGLDLGIGAYGGRDYYDRERLEIPLTADLLFFFNPEDKLQLYGLAGAGVSFAAVNTDENYDHYCNDYDGYCDTFEEEYAYIAGEVGLGLEWRIGRHFALNTDVRGFLRQRVDDQADSNPEFINSNGESTNTSAGALLTLGATVYF